MIYRGKVLELRDGWVWVQIPALTGDSAVGPLPSVIPDLGYGEAVLVAALRGRTDDMMVVSREAEAPYVAPGWVDITGKPSTFTPSAHTHLWADITDKPATFAPSTHTHTLDSGTGRLRFDQLPLLGELPTGADLRTYVTDGVWHQSQNTEAAAGTNYPAPYAGLFEVQTSGSFVYQRYTVYGGAGSTYGGKVYTQTKYNTTWYSWREVPSRAEINAAFAPLSHTHLWVDITDKPSTFAPSAHTHPMTDLTGVLVPGQLPAATSGAAGSMSAADKAKLDAATSAPTASTLAYRDTSGRVQVAAPGADTAAATPKSYVDALVAAVSYATLGVIPTAYLPPLAINETFAPADQAAMLALTAQRGDIAIRSDVAKSFILSTDSPGTLADWKEFLATGQVVSVAGKTGVVSLVKADVGLGSVDNTTDLAKPISTATQTALNGKAASSHTHAAADVTSGTFDPARLPAATGSAAGSLSAADKTKMDAATALATASTLVLRDSSGLFAIATPTSGGHPTTKTYVDAKTWDASDIATGTLSPSRLPAATGSAAGSMSAADKAFLDAATSAATASTLVERDAAGRFAAASPSASGDVATKGYVDAADWTYMISAKPGTDLPATYPTGASIMSIGSDATWPLSLATILTIRQSASRTVQFLASKTTGRIQTRTETDGPAWTSWRELASTAQVTGSADGLMIAADKAMLDAAGSTVVANSLAQRASDGGIQFFRVVSTDTGTPASSHLVRKDWVDTQTSPLAKGIVARASTSTLSGSINTTKTLALELTVAVVTGRNYAIRGMIEFYGETAGNIAVQMELNTGGTAGAANGTVRGTYTIWGAPGATQGATEQRIAEWTSDTTGTARFKINVVRAAGSGNFKLSMSSLSVIDEGSAI